EIALDVAVARAAPRAAARSHETTGAQIFVGGHADAAGCSDDEAVRYVGRHIGVGAVAEHDGPVGERLGAKACGEAVAAAGSVAVTSGYGAGRTTCGIAAAAADGAVDDARAVEIASTHRRSGAAGNVVFASHNRSAP